MFFVRSEHLSVFISSEILSRNGSLNNYLLLLSALINTVHHLLLYLQRQSAYTNEYWEDVTGWICRFHFLS